MGLSYARQDQDRRTRLLVLERDGWACVCCGRSVIGQPYTLQYRKPRSQGGDNSPANLITVHGDRYGGCHLRITSRIDPWDEARGLTLSPHQDPLLVPVMLFGEAGPGVTVWPTADGRWATEAPTGAGLGGRLPGRDAEHCADLQDMSA
jgi:hypothetical protein